MDSLAQAGLTMAHGTCALAAGTTTTISTTGTLQFSIKGKAYSKSAITNGATPTADAGTGLAFPTISANQGTVVVIGLDKDGNIKACQGSIEELDASGAFVRAPQFPAHVPDTMCPIGYIVLKGGSTLVGTFRFGSSNLSSVTGMTYTFVSVTTMPVRPQIS